VTSKKFYEAVAEKLEKSSMTPSAKKVVSSFMAEAFAEDNPRFDEEKFLVACGVVL